jgi:hypothetical protein
VDPYGAGFVVGTIVFYAVVGLIAGLVWPRLRKRRGFSLIAAAIAIVAAIALGAMGRAG